MESGLRLAIERGRLMQSLPVGEGVMVAVRCSEAETRAAIGTLDVEMAGLVVLGAVNGPRNVMLSGAEAAVSALPTALGVEGRRLNLSHAFYSPLMAEGVSVNGAVGGTVWCEDSSGKHGDRVCGASSCDS